jgi:hypothetical protein
LQGAKTKKRTISDIEVYAVARQLSEEDRIEWKRQMYLWEMKKLQQQQQQQQNAPKRLVSLVSPDLNAIAVSVARCRLRGYLIRL